MTDHLERYLAGLLEVRFSGSGVKETSNYPPLLRLLNDVGAELKPKVTCILNPADRGAGIPDGGFFTPDQFQRGPDPTLIKGQAPSRGALEVKGTHDDLDSIVRGEQVDRYCRHYGQLLVTNLRDFRLVALDGDGTPRPLEGYRLAESEAAFWAAAAHPRGAAALHGERFGQFLKRVMLHAAPLNSPQEVAWFLASYARDARVRIEGVDLPALGALRTALEESLGIAFQGERGDHFFRSTLVQTLFYGLFSAWVIWSRERLPHSRSDFDWKTAQWSLQLPVMRALFEQVASPARLKPLGLVEPLDWAGQLLNRVDLDAFSARFEEEQAVQYFYEPFLEAFDPELRKELGVWYTPPEIVRYMVARVDTVLREELGIEDGLADPRVDVLDPCCGTGAYLVEVLKRIEQTLRERRGDGLIADDLKQAAMHRVFGFEILPAPFVVSHLQLGLLLHRLGAPFSEATGERAAVYLTNALTGWEPPDEAKERLVQGRLAGMPEMGQERDAARRVKREAQILVILGNPPYNGFAGVSPKEEDGLLRPYKEGLREWGITKNYLDDLYVRFFRVAERRIAEQMGRGVVCFISNFSYLGEPSFVVMRQHLLGQFDHLWFDCLNGDSRWTGKRTPEGLPDPSVFSTEHNREGIQVGTAVATLVRREEPSDPPVVRYRDLWGVGKRHALEASADLPDFDTQYGVVHPSQSNRFSFRKWEVSSEYDSWPHLNELSLIAPMPGLNDNRGQALHSPDRGEIAHRMQAYFDESIPFEALGDLHRGLTADAASYNAREVRAELLRIGFAEEKIRALWFKPFDMRWAYVEKQGGLWNRVRPELLDQMREGNESLLVRCHAPKSADGTPLLYSRHLADQHVMHKDAYFIPFMVRERETTKQTQLPVQLDLLGLDSAPSANDNQNLSIKSRSYLAAIGEVGSSASRKAARTVFMHALAINYSALYQSENRDALRQDWPRVPLPARREALQVSAELGRLLAALLDPEQPVPGVTSGVMRPELRIVGQILRPDGHPLNADQDLAITVGWGHAGQGGVTMPGQGRAVTRDYRPEELAELEAGAVALGMPFAKLLQLLGESTVDVYLNGTTCWQNVPARVWSYTIGGYQVIKKWLSYRETALLGRSLRKDEARLVTDIARRIAAILLMETDLDENYRSVKQDSFPWNDL